MLDQIIHKRVATQSHISQEYGYVDAHMINQVQAHMVCASPARQVCALFTRQVSCPFFYAGMYFNAGSEPDIQIPVQGSALSGRSCLPPHKLKTCD
jgi:hypothetical protein